MIGNRMCVFERSAVFEIGGDAGGAEIVLGADVAQERDGEGGGKSTVNIGNLPVPKLNPFGTVFLARWFTL